MNATRHPLQPPGEPTFTFSAPARLGSRSGPARSVTLYEEPGIHLTPEMLVIAGRQFPVAELSHLRTVRGPHHPIVVRSVVATGLVLVVIGVTASLTSHLHQLSPATYLALGTAAFVPVLIAAIGQRLRPRAFELWAQYQGQQVLVFSSDHERQYGQVTRALLRAREISRLGGMAEPIASIDPWRPSWR